MNPDFVHLRVHSEFSISDSVIRLPGLVAGIADMDMVSNLITSADARKLIPEKTYREEGYLDQPNTMVTNDWVG